MLCLSFLAHSFSAKAYLERFQAYLKWSQNLPDKPNADFLSFIQGEAALAKKLREKWLEKLAQQKDWLNFIQHYKPTESPNLQCFAQLANYYQGKEAEAVKTAKALWLTGDSLPEACNTLFTVLKSNVFDDNLITQRIALALDKRNLQLARYLLKQYKSPHLKDEQLLIAIYQNPKKIMQLEPGVLASNFYLYGLKRMVSINMDQAIAYWQQPKTQQLLSEAQQQAFLAHLTLYKAMRNQEDAPHWFALVKPAYYNNALLDWEIRYALKHLHWAEVERLVNYSPDKNKPCWQYWLARALEARGETKQATSLYQSLAKTRHYYGFLASLHLNQNPQFEQEQQTLNGEMQLKPYRVVLDEVKSLYRSKQELQASKLFTDFISELPGEEKIAVLHWLANDLQWHGKSVYLSNTEDMSNQLSLRFPLAHQPTIQQQARNYQIPEALIYAIIRQESGFRDQVVSPAGARGLMQVLPRTATVVAKQEHIAYGNKDQLFSSQKNINIGVAYLKQLAQHFSKNPLLIAAAYNAGPRQVNYWLKNHPCGEIDIWIETLPWHETRNYLKNIIAFYAVYQYRLNAKPDIEIFMKPL